MISGYPGCCCLLLLLLLSDVSVIHSQSQSMNAKTSGQYGKEL